MSLNHLAYTIEAATREIMLPSPMPHTEYYNKLYDLKVRLKAVSDILEKLGAKPEDPNDTLSKLVETVLTNASLVYDYVSYERDPDASLMDTVNDKKLKQEKAEEALDRVVEETVAVKFTCMTPEKSIFPEEDDESPWYDFKAASEDFKF